MEVALWYLMTASLIGALGPQPALVEEDHVSQKWGYSAIHDHCMNSGDAAQGITSGILDCNGEEAERQDIRLNQA